MEKIGFIGGTDKGNVIIYVAKLLDDLGKKVLVVDATILQRMKYVVPTINPVRAYITNYGKIDFAIGFATIQELTDYLSEEENNDSENLPYDYMLIDLDSRIAMENFEIEDTRKNYFVTSFDMYSLQKGVEILKRMPINLTLSKILLNYNMKKDNEEYLKRLAKDTNAIWNEDFTVYMNITDENEMALIENQMAYKIRLKRLLPDYQEGIIYITQNIVKDLSASKIRKMIKE